MKTKPILCMLSLALICVLSANAQSPAPEDAFNLSIRVYAPKPEVLNGTWAPPAVKRVE